MKCKRCDKTLPAHPHSGVAKYIFNASDPKTFGDHDKVIFLIKDNAEETSFEDMNEANDFLMSAVEEKNTDVSAKTKEWSLERNKVTPNQALVAQLYNELEILRSRSISGEEHTITEQIPKTLVVCLKCTKPGDTIIW